MTWLVTDSTHRSSTREAVSQARQTGYGEGYFQGNRAGYSSGRGEHRIPIYWPRTVKVFKPHGFDATSKGQLGMSFRVMDPSRVDRTLTISFIARPQTDEARELLLQMHDVEQEYGDWKPYHAYDVPPELTSTGNTLFDEMSQFVSVILRENAQHFRLSNTKSQLEISLAEAFQPGPAVQVDAQGNPVKNPVKIIRNSLDTSLAKIFDSHGIAIEKVEVIRQDSDNSSIPNPLD